MEPISRIDSSTNQLFFRGIDVTDLSKESDYESVLYLLIHGSVPTAKQRNVTRSKMISFRNLYSKDMESLMSLASKIDCIISENSLSSEDAFLAFVSLSAIVAASSLTKTLGIQMWDPDPYLGHAANFLWMMRGKESSNQDISDFQRCLILHMDDPDNPSLTALSEVFSRSSSLSNGLTAALAKHVDVLHHGAGAEAMRMIKEAKDTHSINDYLRHRIEYKQKIFGLGHRIYRGFDPRALILRDILQRRTANTEREWLVPVIEEVAKEGSSLLIDLKGIQAHPNVDLYNAATYTTFGFPAEFNTTLFALSRVAGWSAHIREIQSQ
ncbi:MAG: citrate/2-methylcitrate synthase [Candidatus Thorarchaeota archaeon]